MSDVGVYANFEVLEGTVSGETTLQLARRSRKLVILNDHASRDLQFKFHASGNFATLKPTESVSMYFRAKNVILDGTDVPYRIWNYG